MIYVYICERGERSIEWIHCFKHNYPHPIPKHIRMKPWVFVSFHFISFHFYKLEHFYLNIVIVPSEFTRGGTPGCRSDHISSDMEVNISANTTWSLSCSTLLIDVNWLQCVMSWGYFQLLTCRATDGGGGPSSVVCVWWAIWNE